MTDCSFPASRTFSIQNSADSGTMSPTLRSSATGLFPVALLVAYCLWVGTADLWNMPRQPVKPPDWIEVFDRLLAGAKSDLRGARVVGLFIAVYPDGSEQQGGVLFATQYVLAPVLVDRSLDQKLVIGFFNSPFPREQDLPSSDWKVLHDYGNGVVLFENQGLQ